MCSKLKYFVLALILDAAASSPYNIPRINGNKNIEAAFHPNNKPDVQRRNEEAYLPRSQSTYMSPVPTAVDSEFNEEILRQPSNLRDSRSLNYNNNEREYSRANEQLPSVAQSTKSYANPSSTFDGNKVLSHLLRQNKPIVNNIVEPSTPVNGQEIQNRFYGEEYKQLPLKENVRSEALSHVRYNRYDPLKIQSAPEQRIVFQPPGLPDIANLNAYRPAIPVRNFDMDKEWSNIAKAQPKLPDFISERLRHPVDMQRSQIIGQQVHKPLHAVLPGTGQQYDIQKIISGQRIQNVLSSVKQTKRYLVIHPNGTVEHVDSLAPIAARHPNYVLVNAGHVVSAKTVDNIDDSNVQVPVPTLDPISQSKLPLVSGSQLPEPIVRNKEEVVTPPASSPETSTTEEASSKSSFTLKPEVISSSTIVANIPSSKTLTPEKTSETDETNENQEPKIIEKSLVINDDDESKIQNSSTLRTVANNTRGVKETDENRTNVVNSLSLAVGTISTETVTENNAHDIAHILSNKAENVIEDVLPVVQSIQSIENVEDTETDDINESDFVGTRRSSKPMVYYTSDPDFWTKVSDGKDSNFIYFFQAKSSPRVETDRQRTIYPDGTILEELTETVWDGQGGAPKVTKSSKIIHPDDL